MVKPPTERAGLKNRLVVLTWVFAAILFASGFTSWRLWEGQRPDGDWVRVEPYELLYRDPLRLVGITVGLLALAAATAWLSTTRHTVWWGWATLAVFAATVMILAWGTDVLDASIGIREWSPRGLGGTRPVLRYPMGWTEGGKTEFREVRGWGAGLALWVSMCGLVTCTAALLINVWASLRPSDGDRSSPPVLTTDHKGHSLPIGTARGREAVKDFAR